MKKWLNKTMLRLIGNKVLTYTAAGVVLALLWNRFLNQNAWFSVLEYAFFILGSLMLALAWFFYLKWDGLTLQYLNRDFIKKKKEKKKHSRKDMVDFTEEEVDVLDALDDRERDFCRMAAFLVSGLLLLLPALLALLF
ncbi:MAG: hypothetical protein Q4D90_01775 [bacterium]|nr:hypothetical protein [bacterium]